MKYYRVYKQLLNAKAIYYVGTNYEAMKKIAKERKMEIEEIDEHEYIITTISFTSVQIINN